MKNRLLFILAMILFCGGCSLFHKSNVTTVPELNTGEDISQAQSIVKKSTEEINDASNDISKETLNIKKETDNTREKVSDEVKKVIDPHLSKINDSSDTIAKKTQDINKSVAELSGASSLLKNAEEKVLSLENAVKEITKERDNAIKDRDAAISSKNSQLHKALRWLIVGCVVLTGVFAVLFFLHGSKFGLTGAAICAVVCLIAIFVETYFVYIAIAGGIILLGLAGIIIYQVIIKNKAFKETVETVEVVKDNLSNKTKEKLFGAEGETGIMNTIQSPITMELIKKEKNKMANLWSYAKRKTETGKDD